MQVTKCIDTLQFEYTCHIMNPDTADYGLFISWKPIAHMEDVIKPGKK